MEESDIDASPEKVTRVHFDRKSIDKQAKLLSRKLLRIRFDLVHKLDILLCIFGMAHETDHISTDSLDRPNCLVYILDSAFHVRLADQSSFR